MGIFYQIGRPLHKALTTFLESLLKPKKNSLVQFIKLPKISDDAFLVFGQTPDQIPFTIKRVYYIYGAKPKLARGKHAHHQTQQILFCIRGKVRMVLDNGIKRKECILDKPEVGIMLDKMVWHEMLDMDRNTILLVLASDINKEKDYIRDYQQFLELAKNEHKV